MTSKVVYNGDLRTTMTHLQSGTVVITDAPSDNHGKGEAFSPTDLAATAVASCMLTTMAIACLARDYNIDGAHADVTKVMSATAPRRIAKIIINIFMPDKNYTDEQKKVLEKIAHHCPISLSLHPDTEEIVNFVW
jgi:putative redox protein